MNRRELLQRSAAFSFIAAIPVSIPRTESSTLTMQLSDAIPSENPSAVSNSLKPPTQGSIPVAFLVSEGAVIIDFCGPWAVFQNVSIAGRKDDPFRLYTVAETTNPVHAGGGMK